MSATNVTIPLITIVVAIRNVAAGLKESLDNFSLQDFTNFEVLIADCDSTDNPAQHFGGREFPIVHFVQSDTGIYDAWNKVLPHARGEWVIFMGAGDTFVAPDTLGLAKESLDSLSKEVLIAYGQVNHIGENGAIVQKCGMPWAQTFAGLGKIGQYPHQATFHRTSSFTLCGNFDTSFKIAGDVELILRVARKSEPVFIDLDIANFRYGGTSSKPSNRLQAVKERRRALFGSNVPHRYYWVFIKALLLDALHRVLPEKALHGLIDFYRVATGRERRYH